jgi:hypothetical protein
MKHECVFPVAVSLDGIELARECLNLISEIATRGAWSHNPEHIGYALQELTQVLLERTGSDERQFEPIPADQIGGLHKLREELDFIHGCSQDFEHAALQ